jgi:hypothetical protein
LLADSGSPIVIQTSGKVWIVLQNQPSITIHASGNPEAVITATGSTDLNFTEGLSIREGVYAEQNVTGNFAI